MQQAPASVRYPSWAQWLAQDADGNWWVYEVEPVQYERGWYENEVGRCARVANGEPNADWADTLRRIP
jgi:hypothetical protein